ncbi:MAG: DUF349 domain-containing protein [Muribaculaceae bacterium]|nr:DUF349 domain-containing protein [Muribaculaceae bacterium]MDD6020002.1 DUF349 domain-containing protein [bacterium]MDD6026246.1 DUF349 domain-containing protein [bacterium]
MELRNEVSAPNEELGKDTTLNTEPANEVVAEAAPEVIATEEIEASEPMSEYSSMSKAELVAALEALVEKPVEEIKREENAIKMAFYQIRKEELDKEKEAFLAKGNEEAAFAPREDEDEAKLKELLNQIKEKRAAHNAAIEEARAKNLEAKQAIIDEIRAISGDADNVNKHYNKVQELRHQFQQIGEVPAANATEIWKTYQAAVESFYDMLKLNKELRDYDFKKNLEQKEQLCEEAEKLSEEENVLEAFRSLQALHDKWREIGPVAKEMRETLWARFKEASAAVNKRHQAFFEQRKKREKENEDAKTSLCEKLEAIIAEDHATYAAWDEATKQIIALQEDWKKLGFAARKVNAALFTRFRAKCDEFFSEKAAFFKRMKEEMAANLEKKVALCEKAEALKDSQDWKKTTEALVALQKEWKTVGPVVKKQSDAVWKRFVSACDYFFEQKAKLTVNVRQEERNNLKQKKAVIAAINEQLANADEKEAVKNIRELMKQWQGIGHVPFKEKDKVYAEYKKAVDAAYDKLDMKESRANIANFENALNNMSDTDKMYRERERLVRTYEQSVNELKTFENNLGFFNAQSKSGSSMLKEMERRIAKIKEDIAVLEKKIKLIDEKLG